MLSVQPYDRVAAVAYAHRWAFSRNPRFYDYEEIGGDCTNFASQCLYAGSRVMNYTPVYGWYYINANEKAPAWTGVEYFRFYPAQFQRRGLWPYAYRGGHRFTRNAGKYLGRRPFL